MFNPTLSVQGNLEKTVAMLVAVLDGGTYAAVGKSFGMSRTAVERRVKSIATQLIRAVGVEGLTEERAAFVCRLRAHRSGILEALQHFEASPSATNRPTRVLSQEEINRGALRVKSRSSRPWHDLALFYLPFATGLRPLEIARLTIRDYLTSDGTVRRKSVLRQEVANNGKACPLYFSSNRLNEAIDAYLQERIHLGFRQGPTNAYRGLDPESPIFLDPIGKPYPIASEMGLQHHRSVCRPLLAIYRKLFRYSGIENLSTQSARLTMMHRMFLRGADEKQVGTVLGISKERDIRARLTRTKPTFDELLDELI